MTVLCASVALDAKRKAARRLAGRFSSPKPSHDPGISLSPLRALTTDEESAREVKATIIDRRDSCTK